jgi:hypothetical protein
VAALGVIQQAANRQQQELRPRHAESIRTLVKRVDQVNLGPCADVRLAFGSLVSSCDSSVV